MINWRFIDRLESLFSNKIFHTLGDLSIISLKNSGIENQIPNFNNILKKITNFKNDIHNHVFVRSTATI